MNILEQRNKATRMSSKSGSSQPRSINSITSVSKASRPLVASYHDINKTCIIHYKVVSKINMSPQMGRSTGATS